MKEFIEKVQKGEIDIVENTHKVIEKCKKINDEYHYFNEISEDLAMELAKKAKGKLAGLPVSVKDCICVKGVESRAGSRILTGYKPVFHATAVKRVIDQGGIVIGKTAQDTFGFGSFSTNVGLGMKVPLNPFDKERVCGGSSGGSGGITQKADFAHASLGESTGGSIESPAAFCQVVGMCPTYGRVSRYGLMDYGNSLDKIGPMTKKVWDAAYLLEAIAGKDKRDSTSSYEKTEDYTSFVGKSLGKLKIGIIKEGFGEGVDDEVTQKVKDALPSEVVEVSLPTVFKYGIAAYYLISTSEASTNLAKYCGMRYGAEEKLEGGFNEYFTKVRSKHFNAEAKRRIILGTFARMAGYRDAYYIKATKVRTKIIEEYKRAFKKVDCLVSPTMPFLAPKFSDIEKLTPLQNYMADKLTVGPNLAGIPHMNVPVNGAGMLLMTDHFEEGKLFQVGSAVE